MVKVKLSLFSAGYCPLKEKMMAEGGRKTKMPYPSLVALIEHPSFGPIVFDTGYSERMLAITSKFPGKIFRKITPFQSGPGRNAADFVRSKGYDPTEIRHLIVSHYHSDHIGGLRDFSNATYVYRKDSFDPVRSLKGLKAVLKGFLPDLIPEDLETRSEYIEEKAKVKLPEELAPFEFGYDLFGDGSLIAIDVPGHADGMIGILLRTDEDRDVFLIADATWVRDNYRYNRRPSWLANQLASDLSVYWTTFDRIRELHRRNPNLELIPSHCRETFPDL